MLYFVNETVLSEQQLPDTKAIPGRSADQPTARTLISTTMNNQREYYNINVFLCGMQNQQQIG
jgi:hypothetical protein